MAARGVPFADQKTVWGDPGIATLGLVSDQHEDRVVTAFYVATRAIEPRNGPKLTAPSGELSTLSPKPPQ
jgi:hypothetical protein